MKCILRNLSKKCGIMDRKIGETMRVKFQDLMTKILTRITKSLSNLQNICWYASNYYTVDFKPVHIFDIGKKMERY